MRDRLPKSSAPKRNECAIINLDVQKGKGSHWVAYRKLNNMVEYFDSFGNLKPPQELVQYLGAKANIFYNDDSFQDFNSINCGHLCLAFLYKTN